MNEFIKRCREWQRENPDWEICCDMIDSEKLYTQWDDLSEKEKRYWARYGERRREMFEEFGLKKCKVEHGVLDCNMNMHSIDDWPHGNAMAVYRTKINGIPVI